MIKREFSYENIIKDGIFPYTHSSLGIIYCSSHNIKALVRSAKYKFKDLNISSWDKPWGIGIFKKVEISQL